MNPAICRLYGVAALLLIAGVASAPAWSQKDQSPAAPLVLGLDHIPLAVTDLEGAAERKCAEVLCRHLHHHVEFVVCGKHDGGGGAALAIVFARHIRARLCGDGPSPPGAIQVLARKLLDEDTAARQVPSRALHASKR
jgi:hypothetical protein